MVKELFIIFWFVLIISSTVIAGDHQSERVKNSLTDTAKTEKIQKNETPADKESLSDLEQEGDMQDEEPSVFDDEHG